MLIGEITVKATGYSDWEFGIKDGTAKSFSHVYTAAGNYVISSYAYDYLDLSSPVISKSITVSKPAPVVNTPTTTKTPIVKVASTSLTTPNLLTLADGVNLPLKKAAKFTWAKVTGATKYQIVFSTDNKFGNYDQTKNKCLNTTTCFTYVVAKDAYPLSATHNMLKKDNSFYWFVQAVSKKERSNSSDVRSFSVGTITPPTIETVSASAQEIALGESITLNVVLDRGLPANYSVKASIDNAEFQTMTGSGTSFSLKLSPTQAGEQYFQISLFDSNGIEIDSSGDIFTVTEKAISTTGYTKIANDGSELSDNAVLGSKSKDWACTKDNKTGLTWEVKTDDNGLRDKDWRYSWYKPEGENGGFAGYQNGNGHPEWCKGSDCDTYAFTNAVNKQGLCGANDWRMPTNEELKGLIYCSDGKTKTRGKEEYGAICTGSPTMPTINTMYFPNTQAYWFWSSSPNAVSSSNAWYVYFNGGDSYSSNKSFSNNVRLVR